jgi:hypothetical protein
MRQLGRIRPQGPEVLDMGGPRRPQAAPPAALLGPPRVSSGARGPLGPPPFGPITRPMPTPNPMCHVAPCQPHAAPCQPHAAPSHQPRHPAMRPHAPCQPHAAPCGPMRPRSSGVSAGTPVTRRGHRGVGDGMCSKYDQATPHPHPTCPTPTPLPEHTRHQEGDIR